jgi:hypothetical protein
MDRWPFAKQSEQCSAAFECPAGAAGSECRQISRPDALAPRASTGSGVRFEKIAWSTSAYVATQAVTDCQTRLPLCIFPNSNRLSALLPRILGACATYSFPRAIDGALAKSSLCLQQTIRRNRRAAPGKRYCDRRKSKMECPVPNANNRHCPAWPARRAELVPMR